ncbi:pre-rRNA processing [Malassezia obtusa]|uniref:Pre-rRNA processing n=1 Tax=Malassezia obtusa TaxID=76774 RepID=A0AAF0E2Q6_9BASI|nr:pre-rRNA processing [Malassezia obtusa]
MAMPHAPARRRAPRVPGAAPRSVEELVAAHAPARTEDVGGCVHGVLHACDAAFFDRFLADAAAHAEFAELFLASGVLAQRHTSPLHAEAAADRPTDALLAALRHELSIGTSAHVLLLAYELVLRAGEHNPNVFRWLLYAPNAECLLPGLLRRLTHNVWAGHYAGQSRAVSDVGSVAPALPLPGAALRAAQPPRVDGHVSSEGLQVWLQYKALALLYELLCTVRLRAAELGTCRADAGCIRGPFVCHLFDEAEATREHEDETLGVLVTQLLLALHEQYLATLQGPAAAPFSILAVIRERAHATRTFAENLVFMLNRTPSTDAGGCRFHLLVLKLLDALFAMPETASYFYVNDLKVLVDIFLRQITDLAEHRELLRQVYLRVFPALLTQTQLCTVPYKREDIVYVLTTIVRDGAWSNTAPRTVELARRCLATEWCVDPSATPIVAPIGGGTAHPEALVEEQTRRGAVFHAETSDAAIHTLLKLGQMQSAAAATAAWDDAWPLWPPAPAEAEAPVAELDVLTLEQLDSGRASPQSSASSRGTRRRAPPPPPVEAGQRRAAPTPPWSPRAVQRRRLRWNPRGARCRRLRWTLRRGVRRRRRHAPPRRACRTRPVRRARLRDARRRVYHRSGGARAPPFPGAVPQGAQGARRGASTAAARGAEAAHS